MLKRQGLPNSNYRRQDGVIQQGQATTATNRREIPAGAREGTWAAPDGHALRRIDWTGGERGSLLFLPGRGDFYEKYLETLAHWAACGWQVTAVDWRGQAGSGRLGNDDRTGHCEDFADWVADLGAFWERWAAEHPGPMVVAGHSMGGHLALRAVVDGAIAPDALVLSAPMLGFYGRIPPAVLHPLARAMARVGDPRRPAWKWSEKPGEKLAWRAALLTHDPERYADELWWRETRPELAMGPGSWRWVERAYASMRGLARPGVLEAVTAPAVIVATTADRLVSFAAIERAARRMPRAELVAFGEEAAHEILREADPVRDRALRRIDQFLDQVVPAKP